MSVTQSTMQVERLPAQDAGTLCEAFQLTAAAFAGHPALRTVGDTDPTVMLPPLPGA